MEIEVTRQDKNNIASFSFRFKLIPSFPVAGLQGVAGLFLSLSPPLLLLLLFLLPLLEPELVAESLYCATGFIYL